MPLSESTATSSGQVAVREAQLPGVPVSPSLGPAKTTIAIPARSDLAAPAFAMATNGPDAGRKTVQRCFVEHLRANLERHPETARDVDLPSTLESHHCCDFETIGATTPTHLAPLHANVHDPHGPDGVAAVVRHIKDKSNDLTRAEIMMRARAPPTSSRATTSPSPWTSAWCG